MRRDVAECSRWRGMLLDSGYERARTRTVLRPGEQTLTLGHGTVGRLPVLHSFPFDAVPAVPLRQAMDALIATLI